MWKYIGIIVCISFFARTYGAEDNTILCTMCWFVDGNLAGDSLTGQVQGEIIRQLNQATGVDARNYTTSTCNKGHGSDWVAADQESSGEYVCDGVCTKRIFDMVEFDTVLYQRTCMTKNILKFQQCVEYDESNDPGRPFGINLVVTATCCDSDYCNTAPTFSINSAKFSFFFVSIGVCIVRIMKLL